MNSISIYLGIGLIWGLGFEFLVWFTLNEKFTFNKIDQALNIFLWPFCVCIFIWGMFCRKVEEPKEKEKESEENKEENKEQK